MWLPARRRVWAGRSAETGRGRTSPEIVTGCQPGEDPVAKLALSNAREASHDARVARDAALREGRPVRPVVDTLGVRGPDGRVSPFKLQKVRDEREEREATTPATVADLKGVKGQIMKLKAKLSAIGY